MKYKQITTVLVNAVKEQQAQIDEQERMIQILGRQVDLLKRLVCRQQPSEEVCKEEPK